MLSHKLRGVLCLTLLWSVSAAGAAADPRTPDSGVSSSPAVEQGSPQAGESARQDAAPPAPATSSPEAAQPPASPPPPATSDQAPLLSPAEPTTSTPIVILPSATANPVANPATLNLNLRGETWNATVKGHNVGVDSTANLTVSTSSSIGSLLRTFAEWQYDGGPTTVQAGLECSLFGPDHWRASRKMQPFESENAMAPLTELSVGVDVMQGAKLHLTGVHSEASAELGTGLSYKTSTGFEWGASVKARRLRGEQELPWINPAVEGNLRWSW